MRNERPASAGGRTMYVSAGGGSGFPGTSGGSGTLQEVQTARLMTDMRGLRTHTRSLSREIDEAHRATLLRLACAVEMRDGETGVHIFRVGQSAGLIALRLTGNRAMAELVCRAAPLHDIGKIGIPDAILKKEGPFERGERLVMQQHPTIGAKILGSSPHPLFAMARDIALYHHERFDGGGYPTGLSGTSIPLAARITAVADFYDAVTMDRCYRPGRPHAEVMAALEAGAGLHFDPTVVEAFQDAQRELAELRVRVEHQFSSGEADSWQVTNFAPLY